MKAKIIIGKAYYNPFLKKKFIINAINEDNTIFCTYEDDTSKIWERKELQLFLDNTINRQLPNWEMNANFKNYWSIDLVRQGITDIHDIMDNMLIHKEDPEPSIWDDSRFEDFKNLKMQSKGPKSCDVFCCYMETKGYTVNRDQNGEYAYRRGRVLPIGEHRYIIRSICIDDEEQKKVTINHLRWEDDWTKMVVLLVFPNKIEMYEADRDDVFLYLEENPSETVPIERNSLEVHHWSTDYPLPDVFRPLF